MVDVSEDQDPLHYIVLEQESRRRRTTRLEIIDGTRTSGIGVPGSLAAFITRKGSGALDDVRRAALGDRAATDRLMARYGSAPVRPAPPPDNVYAQMVVDSDVFANIRYGGTDLSKGILLHRGVDLVAFSFPYNGGRLDAEGVTLVEFFRGDGADEFEGLVVQMSPPLTAAEQTALDALADEETIQNVGDSLSCSHTTYFVVGAAALFVMAGAAIVGVAVLVAVKAEDDATHLTDEQVRDLDPSASARELLAIRRRLLLEQQRRHS